MIVLLIALPNDPNTALRWNSSAVTGHVQRTSVSVEPQSPPSSDPIRDWRFTNNSHFQHTVRLTRTLLDSYELRGN